jgi:hypothetical protein
MLRKSFPAIPFCCTLGVAAPAFAQDSPDAWADAPHLRPPIPPEFLTAEEKLPSTPTARPAEVLGRGMSNGLPNIMITGYWPPTNEMIRRFSANPERNPEGWIGENWEGRGFNIYAFFPEFPGGFLQRGQGDFEVDYQDTSNDWWFYVDVVKPVGIVTFSRAGNDFGWELEGGNRTYVATQWTADYLTPLRPTPELPIMQLEPPGTERMSTQPMQEIVNAVLAEVPGVNAFLQPIDDGRFLSNYIGYHGNWYRDLHADFTDPLWCVTAGHVHVGSAMSLAQATHATEVTLRVVLSTVAERLAIGDMNCDGAVSVSDIGGFVLALTDPVAYEAQYPDCNMQRADINMDSAVTVSDVGGFITLLTGG